MDNTTPGGRNFPIDTPTQAPSRYGQFSPTPKVYRIDLSTARTAEKTGIGGSFIWAYKASDTGVSADIRFNSQQSDAMTFFVGTSIGGLKFSELYVTNAAQAGAWIDFFVIDQGEIITSLNPANVFTSVSIAKTSGLVTVADATIVAGAAAALILPANANRTKALLTSLVSNTQEVRIGDSNTGAGRGAPLQPGESIEIDSTADIYAYTAAGANQTISIAYTE